MSWFKVDDELHGNPKRLLVSTAAMGLWVCAGSWSRDKKTGGYIPREALRVIAPDLDFDEASALAEELVNAKHEGLHEHGLWTHMANGWQFVGWEQFQPEDEVEAHRRETISKVRSEAGLRGAQARWQKLSLLDGKNGFANGNGEGPGSRARPRAGSPTPSPSGSSPVSQNQGSGSDQLPSYKADPKDLEEIARVGDGSSDGSTGPDLAAPGTGQGPFKSDAEREVFEHWLATLWRKVSADGRAARATPPRLTRIRQRLKRFTVSELKAVIDRVSTSKWHLGENDSGKAYIEPKTIFRNDETVEDWLTVRGKPPGQSDHEAQAGDEARRKRRYELLQAAGRGEFGERFKRAYDAGKDRQRLADALERETDKRTGQLTQGIGR